MNRLLAALLVCSAGCSQDGAGSSPIVTEPVWHLEVDNRLVDGEAGPAAVKYLEAFAGELGLSGEEEWQVLSVSRGGDGLAHVRVQETHRGVPVLGSEIAVHADQTTFIAWGGKVTRNLEGFEVEPAVTAAQATASFKEAHAAAAAIQEEIRYREEASRLAIQPRAGEGADLVWQLEVFNEAQPGVQPARWFILVDAASGELLQAWNGLATLEQASGPGGNPSVARSWSAQLDVEPKDGQYAMQTDRLETFDMNNGDGGLFDHWFGTNGELVVGPLDPIGDAAINDAHGHAEITLDMMRDWYGHNSIDDAGMRIVSRVHYGENYLNAFWDGKRMTYGDGEGSFHPFSTALDVVAHEINHGFTEKHSNLTYKNMSGALNESFSDVAGGLAEFYQDPKNGNLEVGEDITDGPGGGFRSMCAPTIDGYSIDHASDFEEGFYIGNLQTSGTDVHHASGVANKAFCLVAGRFLAAHEMTHAEVVRAVGAIWYLANAGYWTSDASFTQGCQGTVDAARALGLSSDDVVAVHQSWADVGVSCEGGPLVCNSDNTCNADAGESCFSCATDCGSCRDQCSFWKKAKCKIGIGDCSRCTEEEGCGDGVCGEDESDVSCARDCGCSAPGDSCGSVAPFGCYCDDACSANGDCCADADVCTQ
jgi:vibriolysin